MKNWIAVLLSVGVLSSVSSYADEIPSEEILKKVKKAAAYAVEAKLGKILKGNIHVLKLTSIPSSKDPDLSFTHYGRGEYSYDDIYKQNLYRIVTVYPKRPKVPGTEPQSISFILKYLETEIAWIANFLKTRKGEYYHNDVQIWGIDNDPEFDVTPEGPVQNADTILIRSLFLNEKGWLNQGVRPQVFSFEIDRIPTEELTFDDLLNSENYTHGSWHPFFTRADRDGMIERTETGTRVQIRSSAGVKNLPSPRPGRFCALKQRYVHQLFFKGNVAKDYQHDVELVGEPYRFCWGR